MQEPDRSGATRRRARLALLAVSAAAGAAVAALVLARGGEPELFEVRSVPPEALELLAERALPPGDEPRPIALEPMDEPTARLLYNQLQNASNRYDPLLGFRYVPNFERRYETPEHPDGGWWLRTNDHGLRMVADVRETPPDLRVLVIGDSHTDGICNNDEGYPFLLQELLSEALAPRTVEVLNAGKSGYSFYQYLAAPAAFAELEPDLYVVCVYGGNDFSEVLLPHLYHQRLAPPAVRPLGEERLERANAGLPPGVPPQGLMQSALVQENPQLEELAADGALRVTRALDAECRERGLPWIGVYLPPMADVQREELEEAYLRAERELGLDGRGLGVAERLSRRWLALLEELGVPSLDLGPPLRAAAGGAGRLYWERDHHIDPTAHRVVAEALAPLVLRALASGADGG